MAAFDIWLGASSFRLSNDVRPWVLIDERGDQFGCFPLSSVCYGEVCFEISDTHPDFAATGLDKRSFVYDESLYELSMSDLTQRLGQLEGALLVEFKKFAGL